MQVSMQGWPIIFCHRNEHLPREWISPAATLYFIEKLVKTLNGKKTKEKGKRKKEKGKEKREIKGRKDCKIPKKRNCQRNGKGGKKEKKKKRLKLELASRYITSFQWHIIAMANPDGWVPQDAQDRSIKL